MLDDVVSRRFERLVRQWRAAKVAHAVLIKRLPYLVLRFVQVLIAAIIARLRFTRSCHYLGSCPLYPFAHKSRVRVVLAENHSFHESLADMDGAQSFSRYRVRYLNDTSAWISRSIHGTQSTGIARIFAVVKHGAR